MTEFTDFLSKLIVTLFLGIATYYIYFPDDPKRYKYYAYYVTENNEAEATFAVYNLEDIDILLDYYEERKNKAFDEVVVPADTNKVWRIPLKAKVKVLKKINKKNIVKVKVIYNKGRTKKKCYIPTSNLHKKSPFVI